MFALHDPASPRGFETGIGTAVGVSSSGFTKILRVNQNVWSEKIDLLVAIKEIESHMLSIVNRNFAKRFDNVQLDKQTNCFSFLHNLSHNKYRCPIQIASLEICRNLTF